MSSTAGRIDELDFKVCRYPSLKEIISTWEKGVAGALFGLSILTASIRTTYRIQTHGRLTLDDFMLIVACVFLTAATGLLYVTIPLIYWEEEILLNPESTLIGTVGSEDELLAKSLRFRQLVFSHLTLTWVTIFSVKICFLLFFLQLVDRLKRLMFIWKVVFAITISVFCFCVCGTFIACPSFRHNDACKSGSFARLQSSQHTTS